MMMIKLGPPNKANAKLAFEKYKDYNFKTNMLHWSPPDSHFRHGTSTILQHLGYYNDPRPDQ